MIIRNAYQEHFKYDLSITLEEAYNGKKQEISFASSEKCERCDGYGAEPELGGVPT